MRDKFVMNSNVANYELYSHYPLDESYEEAENAEGRLIIIGKFVRFQKYMATHSLYPSLSYILCPLLLFRRCRYIIQQIQ